MQIEPKSLIFEDEKVKEFVSISNNSNNRVIFKVKVTNTILFNIYPGKGHIEPSETVNINVTLKNRQREFAAKLLVQYASVSGMEEEVTWSQIEKGCIKEQQISITGGKPRESRPSKEVTFKKTESPVYEPEMEGSKSSKSSISGKSHSNPPQIVPQLMSSGTLYNSVSDMRNTLQESTSMGRKERASSRSFENRYQSEKEKNSSLRTKLQEREKKLEHYQNLSQRSINQSVKDKTQDFQLGPHNICLLILVCLMFGFLLAKTGSRYES